MTSQHTKPVITILLLLFVAVACVPQTPTAPPVDSMGTIVAQLASGMQTQTAAAYTPTPTPRPVKATKTRGPTKVKLTATKKAPIAKPITNKFTSCWYGPGSSYELDSNIEAGQKVQLEGRGSVDGWLVILNPYFHKLCWISAADLDVDPLIDLNIYPVMTPGH